MAEQAKVFMTSLAIGVKGPDHMADFENQLPTSCSLTSTSVCTPYPTNKQTREGGVLTVFSKWVNYIWCGGALILPTKDSVSLCRYGNPLASAPQMLGLYACTSMSNCFIAMAL